jgi:hypothetical protein
MRLAHLILAHSQPNQLMRLVKSLLYKNDDIYIHIDAKSDWQQFLPLATMPHVFLIEKREKVYWGAFSIVQATLNGFEAILATKIKYDFVNLLSGQDYPLQSIDKMHVFFEANKGKAFMEFYSVNDTWKEAIPRITQYHLTDYHFVGTHFLQRVINFVLPKRKPPLQMTFVGRSQWFTIGSNHIKYIVEFLQKNASVRRFFKMTWGADEFVFQTILFNSPFKNSMVNNNLRYIDWSGGGVSPKTFTVNDAETLLQSDRFFARKFDAMASCDLLNLVDEKIAVSN